MRSVVLLLLGIHLVNAGMHSHIVIYTATKGVPDFPEFVAATMVDGTQVNYYDSEIKEVIPRQDWVRGAVDEQFWQRNTQIRSSMHQTFKNNINIAMERFNQTQGVHTFQQMYGCEMDDTTGATDGFYQYGYDGEDFVAFDLKNLRWVSPKVQAFLVTESKWNNDRGFVEGRSNYLKNICIEWLRKYVDYGKNTLERTVSPQVSLLQKPSSSSVTCHATGFYPSGVTISWQKNGHDHYEDVDLGELLPNEDGTFQKTSTIRVTPDEWKNNKFKCVVEHQGEIKTANEIWTNKGESVPIGIIVGALAAVILLILIGAAGFVVYKKKQGFKPVSGSDDGSNSSAQAVPQA